MITQLPPTEWVIVEVPDETGLDEWLETFDYESHYQKYLDDLDDEDLVRKTEEEYARKNPNRSPKPIRTGRYEFRPFEGLGSAVYALAVVFALASVIEKIQNYDSPRTRRRRRTHLCVTTCLSIIADARRDVKDGYHENNALITETDEPRKTRKFVSRK